MPPERDTFLLRANMSCPGCLRPRARRLPARPPAATGIRRKVLGLVLQVLGRLGEGGRDDVRAERAAEKPAKAKNSKKFLLEKVHQNMKIINIVVKILMEIL